MPSLLYVTSGQLNKLRQHPAYHFWWPLFQNQPIRAMSLDERNFHPRTVKVQDGGIYLTVDLKFVYCRGSLLSFMYEDQDLSFRLNAKLGVLRTMDNKQFSAIIGQVAQVVSSTDLELVHTDLVYHAWFDNQQRSTALPPPLRPEPVEAPKKRAVVRKPAPVVRIADMDASDLGDDGDDDLDLDDDEPEIDILAELDDDDVLDDEALEAAALIDAEAMDDDADDEPEAEEEEDVVKSKSKKAVKPAKTPPAPRVTAPPAPAAKTSASGAASRTAAKPAAAAAMVPAKATPAPRPAVASAAPSKGKSKAASATNGRLATEVVAAAATPAAASNGSTEALVLGKFPQAICDEMVNFRTSSKKSYTYLATKYSLTLNDVKDICNHYIAQERRATLQEHGTQRELERISPEARERILRLKQVSKKSYTYLASKFNLPVNAIKNLCAVHQKRPRRS